MCGILAIYHQDKKNVDAALLENMARHMHYRGPDEEGVFVENNIGFFHKRLSIIDLQGD